MRKTDQSTKFLTVADVSKYLNISRSQAYELAHRRDFPVTHIGGCIRVPEDAFYAWVELKTSIPAEIAARMSVA